MAAISSAVNCARTVPMAPTQIASKPPSEIDATALRVAASVNGRHVVCKIPVGGAGRDEWHELAILANLVEHLNVIKLVGVCVDWPADMNDIVCAVAIVTELQSQGTIEEYLQREGVAFCTLNNTNQMQHQHSVCTP